MNCLGTNHKSKSIMHLSTDYKIKIMARIQSYIISNFAIRPLVGGKRACLVVNFSQEDRDFLHIQ